jgi:hypothetical protein
LLFVQDRATHDRILDAPSLRHEKRLPGSFAQTKRHIVWPKGNNSGCQGEHAYFATAFDNTIYLTPADLEAILMPFLDA